MQGFFDLVAVAAITSLLGFAAARTYAHGGGINTQGCHNDRKGGMGYHCYRSEPGSTPGSGRPAPLGLLARSAGGGPFRNCAAARAASAALVRGDAGYGRHLDRDGDGVGCE
ncbi:excalibur calcium-binding domain-containing protein [Sphingomonas sp. PB2P12]|uniref:excalibur calcium-binding domain-containing protein n=1 Tax=Sphingomonas sandaracina TaxID=3096157 RepID=UPI002FCAEC4D